MKNVWIHKTITSEKMAKWMIVSFFKKSAGVDDFLSQRCYTTYIQRKLIRSRVLQSHQELWQKNSSGLRSVFSGIWVIGGDDVWSQLGWALCLTQMIWLIMHFSRQCTVSEGTFSIGLGVNPSKMLMLFMTNNPDLWIPRIIVVTLTLYREVRETLVL